ncbi:hypothetical protein PMAYCL1PPCAC_08361, partial [Pristionchus mayeri]
SLKIACGFAFLVDLFVTVQVFIACRRNRAILVVPMLIITILWMLLSVYKVIKCTIVLIDPTFTKGHDIHSDVFPLKIQTLFEVAKIVLFIWTFTVLKDCYIYLRELERPRINTSQNAERTTRF